MITNIPRGMSQNNRAHPFFIILRRYSEQEESDTKNMMKHFITSLLIPFICNLPIIIVPWGRFFAISFIGMWAFHAMHSYWEIRKILANTSYGKVNHMIFGDQYSASPLNYEEVVNMIGAINLNLGRISAFLDSMRSTSLCFIIAIAVFFAINIFKIIITL